MNGNKASKKQEKRRRRLYLETPTRFGSTFRTLRQRRLHADEQDARAEVLDPRH